MMKLGSRLHDDVTSIELCSNDCCQPIDTSELPALILRLPY